jgi:osmotically-inducible protein OsmY
MTTQLAESRTDRSLVEMRRKLAQRVEEEVRARTCGRIRGLEVVWENGRVVLTGQTGAYYAKQLASHAALDVTHADCPVLNDIRVA